jgi:hypothetical protein
MQEKLHLKKSYEERNSNWTIHPDETLKMKVSGEAMGLEMDQALLFGLNKKD